MLKGDLYTKKERYWKKIKVGKTFYKIYICKSLKLNNKYYGGFTRYDEREIILKEGKDIEEILAHELTHAFMHEIYKVKNMKHKKMIKTLRSYERFIEDFAVLIKQNFDLKNKSRLK